MTALEARSAAEVLDDAEGLARVLRLISGGKLDLQPVTAVPGMPHRRVSWDEARIDAAALARRPS